MPESTFFSELIEGLTLREFLTIDHTGMPQMMGGRRKSGAAAASADGGFEDGSVDSGEQVVAFGLDRLGEEPDSDLGEGAHVSGNGPDALRRLADAMDEPFTEDSQSLEPSALLSPPPQKEFAELRAPNLHELNRPERIALLLPLSGAVQETAEALRDGFLAAHFQRTNRERCVPWR